jgi:GNAT superfamily N-acetyltransferase
MVDMGKRPELDAEQSTIASSRSSVALLITQVESEADIDSARVVLAEYMAWTLTVEGDAHDAPTFRGHAEELATLPGVYVPPAGRLFLAREAGRVAGCVAIKPHDKHLCELKRLYVRPGFRGRGLGERLVRLAIDEARAIGYERMMLDSHISMRSAHTIYRSLGFGFVDAPADFPERFKSVVVFMERDLA